MNDLPLGGAVPAGGDDMLLPYQAESLDVRGRTVRLGPAVDAILKRHAYPNAVSRVVGEAIVITAMLGSVLKSAGRFQLQTKTNGAVSMIVVDFDAPDRLRAMAQFNRERVAALSQPGSASSAALLGSGHLAFTIEPGGAAARYQGIVALDGQGLEAASRQYFRQSEQIPTEIRIAVAEQIDNAGASWRAGGLLAQFLPKAPERMRRADLDPGDAPAGMQREARPDDDAWAEAKALVSTIEDHELVDARLSSEDLLFRLFNQRGVTVYAGQQLIESCGCSRERIVSTLKSFQERERLDMIGPDGRIGVGCEFCSTHYVIEPGDIAAAD